MFFQLHWLFWLGDVLRVLNPTALLLFVLLLEGIEFYVFDIDCA